MSGKDGGGGGNEMKSSSATDLGLLQGESWHLPAPAFAAGCSVAAVILAKGPAVVAMAPLQHQSDRFSVSAVSRR